MRVGGPAGPGGTLGATKPPPEVKVGASGHEQ